MKSSRPGVQSGCLSWLSSCFGLAGNLSKKILSWKESVPEGLTQSRAENLLSSGVSLSFLHPAPASFAKKGLIWVPEKN